MANEPTLLQAGRRPLHIACSVGEWSIVEALIQHSADLEARDEVGHRITHLSLMPTDTVCSSAGSPSTMHAMREH